MLVRYQPITNLFGELDSIVNLSNVQYPFNRQKNRFAEITMKESENELTVLAQLPGIAKEDVKVGLNDGVLTISGERKQPELQNNEQWIRNEIRYGTFERTVNLPYTVDTDKVSAVHENGILRITLPKHENAKPKQIAIR